MIARCARCQGTFTTDRFGRQVCPHCGSELLLADPNAPAAGPAEGAPPPPPPEAPPPAPAGGPPPSPPPAGGWGPPPGGGWGPPPGGGGWGGGGPPPGYPEVPSPFAERRARGFFPAFLETWKLVATQPQEFFRRVRIDQPGTAILFGVIASFVGTIVNVFYRWVFAEQFRVFLTTIPGADSRFTERFGELSSSSGLIGQIVFTPILTVALIYVSAGVIHLLLMLFRGARRPFDATLTAVAYANGLNLLLVVPGCGSIVAFVWGLVVLVIGLGEIQRCGPGKAAAAVFAPLILVCVCCCGAFSAMYPLVQKALDAAKSGGTVDL